MHHVEEESEHAHDTNSLVPAKLSSEMISSLVDTELVQEMFIAHHTINVYGLSCN